MLQIVAGCAVPGAFQQRGKRDAGNWRSIDTASTGNCTNIRFSVTRTGAIAASVTFGASCGASSISAYAVGSVSSDALVWQPEYVGTLSVGPGDIRCGGLPQVGGTASPSAVLSRCRARDSKRVQNGVVSAFRRTPEGPAEAGHYDRRQRDGGNTITTVT